MSLMFSGSGDDYDTISSADSPVSANRQTRFSLKLLYFFSGVALLALLLSVFVQGTISVLLSLGCVFLAVSALWGYVVFKSQLFSKTSCNLSLPIAIISLLLAIFVNSIIIYFAGRSLGSALLSITNGYVNGVWWSSIITSLSLGGVFEFITYVRTPLGWCAAIAFGQLALFILWYLMKNLVMHVIVELRDNHRDYLKRCLSFLFPVSLVAFLYLVYAPYEVFFANPSDMGSLIFTDFWWIFVVAFVCSVLISVLVLSFFIGCAFRWVTCLVFGFGIASYVQMMFLNGGLGILDGNIPSALTDPLQLGLNILIWAVILAVPLVLNHFVPGILDSVVRYGSLIVTILLAVSVVFMVVTAPVNAFERSDSYYLSAEDQFVLSSNDNIVLFIVDYDSNNYFDALVAEDPSVLEVFKDFTYYNNSDSVYMGTFPSVNHMLTGSPLDTTVKIDQWFADSWSSDSATYFYDALLDKNYRVNLYVNPAVINAEYMLDKVSNVVVSGGDVKVSLSDVFDAYVDASYYKLLPNILKAQIYYDVAGYDYTNFVKMMNYAGRATQMNNPDYYSKLTSIGLSADIESNLFTVQHILGTHAPCSTSEDCTYLEGATLMQTQKGCIVLLNEYFTQMKELGVYDDATIIVTSDHGDFWKDIQPIFFIKEPHVVRDNCEIVSTPISHADLLPTILANVGVDYSSIGTSIYDFSKTSEREREHYVRKMDSSYPDVPKYNSNAYATSNVYYVYTYVGDRVTLDEKVAEKDYAVVPMLQGFF